MNLFLIFLFFILFNKSFSINSSKINHDISFNNFQNNIILLNTSNFLSIKNTINTNTANDFIYNLNLIDNKNDIYIYIDSPGGSVEDGFKIMNEIIKYNITCIADRAYSMAFAILQSCHTRYLLNFGKLMQHQISFGIFNEKEKIQSYLNFVNQMESELLFIQSQKIGISSEELKNKTLNEWWIFGNNALTENCVDDIINIQCTTKLTSQTFKINDGYYEYTYSKCPLIPSYIDKKENNQNNKDLIYFI